ncbi:MAG TPA: LL-diaminopimelate aminotransferase [Clostridiales bacterium]|nr:LL-diaminopimelate aminotransferase [Clostridiales bacterium]
MVKPNVHYKELQSSYLFYNISLKTKAYCEAHPGTKLLRLGVGDVTLPLCSEVIKALHEAVEDQAHKERFHGYMPECGADFYKKVLKEYYEKRNVLLEEEEIFASSGASDELGDILDLFSADNTVLVMEPAYPAYVDANVIAGHRIIHYPSDASNGFTPLPKEGLSADMIYICSPNNPTGAVFTKEKLKKWVDFANETGAVILFDAAYEAYIKDESLPHSIYEVEGSRSCAIEISSLSKTAGFTGTRCGYTVIPKALVRQGMCFNDMWVRNRTTKTNGVSYILQRGAAAVFTPEGQRQIHENIGVYKKNAAVLMEALDRCGIRYFGGKNAPYVWMQCPNGMGGWELFDFLLEKAQIVGTPGEGFGACGTGYFRLSSFGSPEDTAEAARRIVALFGKE